MKRPRLLLIVCIIATVSYAQTMPPLKGKALDNTEVSVPAAGGRQILILIVGFSQKSGDFCRVWSKKIAADYHADGRLSYFSLPVLQGAPSLFRPLIVRGIRKSLPLEEQRRFVPIYSNESDWKKFVNFSAPDDAYLVIADPEGHLVWQAHGAYSDAVYGNLQKSVANLLEKFAK
jgi:hypothetical protein